MKVKREDWGMIIVMAAIVLFVLANVAYAGDRDHRKQPEPVIVKQPIVNNYYSTEIVTQVVEEHGTSLAIATAQIHNDWNTSRWQMGVGMGEYGKGAALVVGFGKRYKKMLFSGSIGKERGRLGGGIGMNWRF